MQQLACSEIWGGVRNQDVDLCSRAMIASLWSRAAEGGRGGDLYYLSVCGDDILTRVALADVAGHGEAVADVAQWLYGALREHLASEDGGEVLAELNRKAVGRGAGTLASAALAAFVRDGSSLHFSYAGHHPMLLRRRGEPHWLPLELEAADEPVDLPLGVVPEARYTPGRVAVGSGDRILLYTDGVLEAPGPDGERFGEVRLRRVLDGVGDAELGDVKRAVLDELRAFSGGRLDHDDVTLVALEAR